MSYVRILILAAVFVATYVLALVGGFITVPAFVIGALLGVLYHLSLEREGYFKRDDDE